MSYKPFYVAFTVTYLSCPASHQETSQGGAFELFQGKPPAWLSGVLGLMALKSRTMCFLTWSQCSWKSWWRGGWGAPQGASLREAPSRGSSLTFREVRLTLINTLMESIALPNTFGQDGTEIYQKLAKNHGTDRPKIRVMCCNNCGGAEIIYIQTSDLLK